MASPIGPPRRWSTGNAAAVLSTFLGHIGLRFLVGKPIIIKCRLAMASAMVKVVDLGGLEPPTRGLATHRSTRLVQAACGLATSSELQAQKEAANELCRSKLIRWPFHTDRNCLSKTWRPGIKVISFPTAH